MEIVEQLYKQLLILDTHLVDGVIDIHDELRELMGKSQEIEIILHTSH